MWITLRRSSGARQAGRGAQVDATFSTVRVFCQQPGIPAPQTRLVTMKSSLRLTLGSLLLGSLLFSHAMAKGEAGYVDFGKLVAPIKGEYVDITLGKGLLKIAGVIAKCKDREAAELISGLTSVRVNVVGLDDTNRSNTTERIATLRQELARDGWEQIITARGKKQEDVAIFVKQRDGEVIEGVVVTVIDDRKKEAVFVNVVGQIKADKLAEIGERLDIPHLRHTTKAEKS
jgi:hypothetical protein